MDKLKAIEELAEKWVKQNSLTAGVIGSSVGEVKAFVGGFMTAIDLSRDAWDSGYAAGKAYGEGRVEVKEDA